MKLALKLCLAMLLPIVVVVLINGGLRLGREARLIEGEGARAQARLVRALATAIGDNWETGGIGFARRLMNDLGGDGAGLLFADHLDAVASDNGQRSRLLFGETVMSTLPGESGQPTIKTVSPVVVDGIVRGYVAVTDVLDEEEAYLAGTVIRSIALTVILSVIALSMSLLAGMHLLGRPLKHLVDSADRLGGGDLTVRVTDRSTDELASLAVAFNRMAMQLQKARDDSERDSQARVETLNQLRHAERLTTVGRLSAGLAHELGTPLNVVIGRAELVADGEVLGDEARENGRIIVEQGQRMNTIIRQLLEFARARRPRPRRTDVAAVFRTCQEMLRPLAKERGATIEVALNHSIVLEADGDQLEQMVINLAVNGLQAMTAGITGTRLVLDADIASVASDSSAFPVSFVRLKVSDEGSGIPADVQSRIFDPFFTTKDVGEGTGLGLAVIHGLVEEHRGYITFQTSPTGTTFTVNLPAQAAIQADDAKQEAS